MTLQTAFVSTMTDDGKDGIRIYDVAVENDLSVRSRGTYEAPAEPTFLAMHPNKRHVYAVNEIEEGTVTAYQIESGEPRIDKINRVSSGSGGPCHCHTHPSGNYLFVAHYSGGVVSVLPIGDDGGLGSPVDIVKHRGSSEHPDRQTQPHPHSILSGPAGRFLYVPDLGTDEIIVYRLDEQSGSLKQVTVVNVQSGAGPRYLDFHPNGTHVYVTNELNSTVTTFERDRETESLIEIDTVSTVPPEFDGENFPSDIHVHPSGKWVFCSNRGHDSIAVFEVEEQKGGLIRRGSELTRGKWPRSFALNDSGQLLMVGNVHTDSVSFFRFDGQVGTLDQAGDSLDVPDPVFVKWLPE